MCDENFYPANSQCMQEIPYDCSQMQMENINDNAAESRCLQDVNDYNDCENINPCCPSNFVQQSRPQEDKSHENVIIMNSNECFPQQNKDFNQCFPNPCNQQQFCQPPPQNYEQQPMQNEEICMQPYCNDPCTVTCEPPEQCRPKQGLCPPYKCRRYIQPPRTQSFKPLSAYKKPDTPMAAETVYTKSYECIDSQSAALARLPQVRPTLNLTSPHGAFEKETVTKLSYQPCCENERTRLIIPRSHALLGKGPMQSLTTQKHDFVPKYQYRRTKIFPRDNIKRSCGCIEQSTVQRLSFMFPCGNLRTESFKPIRAYIKPITPMEFNTTQKLSFMPVCTPSKRENHPWAQKRKYTSPTLPFTKDTITKLSYQPPGCFVDEKCCNTYQEQNGVCCDAPCAEC